ncbi:hypothetical protein SASPL_120614 [Salvia splendens]|uniref:Uncharacterized protein n=1 Tax=Salvia splendens TaxID=180675 RepID=A0A8X8XQ06_SALSN|nr:hypothetical protein SASPL_120614 [Salvia splendens]
MSTSSKRLKFSLDDTKNKHSKFSLFDQPALRTGTEEQDTLWKSDNGFRTGYLGKIEDALKAQFSLTDIKGTTLISFLKWLQ